MVELDEIMTAYSRGPDELLAAIGRVDPDAARGPDEWTSRMIVHHLADGEALWLQPMKFALLRDGFEYQHNMWLQDESSAALAYATRELAPSLALFRAQRGHVCQLLADIPNALRHHIVFAWRDERRPVTVADVVNMQIGHLTAHLAEITENGRASGS